jgi:hypothetical protein
MRDINVYNSDSLTNANNIKSAFDTYVTGYFSNVTVDSTTDSGVSVYVNFYITGRETPAFQIRVVNNSRAQLLVGNDTWTINYNITGVARVIVTDNAIAVGFTGNSSERADYVTIYKTESNDIMLYIAKTGSDNTIADFIATHESSYTVVMYKLLDSSISWYTNTALINTDGYVLGAPLVHRTSGASKNVFIPLNRCYSGIHEAFKFQIGSDSYVGIGYNSLIVKSE